MAGKNTGEKMDTGVYHGIIVSISQRDKSIFRKLTVIGRKRVLFGLITLYKIQVDSNKLNDVIREVQKNMAGRILFMRQEFYAHFYRGDELIILFRENIFNVSPDPAGWWDAIAFGRQLGIREAQLDFTPCRFEDEVY
jgi:hypothetical protein